MAELVFKVRADYEEVVAMRNELERLRNAMLNMNTSVDGWEERMEHLEKQYKETSDAMRGMVDDAAKAGAEIKNNTDAALKNATGSAEQLAGVLSMVKDGLSSYIREQVRSGEMDQETAKKARLLVATLSGLQSVLKAVQKAQAANAKAAAASATSTTAETTATAGLATSQIAATATTKTLTTSVHGLNAAMKANPIGIALTLLPLVTGFITDATAETDGLTREIKEMNKETKKQLEYLDELYTTLEDSNMSTRKRRDAIEEVNKMCEEYNVTLLSENDTLEQQRIKYEKLTVAIRNATAAKIGEKYITKAQDKADDRNAKALKNLKTDIKWTPGLSKDVKSMPDEVWDLIAVEGGLGAEVLAGLEGLDYLQKFNEVVRTIKETITANTGVKDLYYIDNRIKSYVKSLDENQRALNTRSEQVNSAIETYKKLTTGEESPLDLLNASFEDAEAAYDGYVMDLADVSKASEMAANEMKKQEAENAMFEKAIQGTRKELKDRKSRLQKEIDELPEDSEKQKKLQLVVESIDAELKKRTGKDEPKPNGGKEDKEQKEMERAYERYESQMKRLVDQIEENIAKEQIAAIDDNEEAVSRRFDLEKQMLIEKANEIAEAMEGVTGDTLVQMKASYEQLMGLIDEYDNVKRKNEQKRRDDAERASMNEFLRDYGSYEEKKLAITRIYEDKITKAKTEGERMALKKELESSLRELEHAYDVRYSLIFANVDSMSDNLLQEAIDSTQNAIKDAKDSGDIQALTQLYARLRAQMSEMGDRKSGWGWNAISEGFGLRAGASDKRARAKDMEESLAVMEKGLLMLEDLKSDSGEIQKVRDRIEALRIEIQNLYDSADQDEQNATNAIIKGFSQVSAVFSELGASMASFRDGKGKMMDTIADIGEGLQGIAAYSDEIRKAQSGEMKSGEAWSTIISGTIELVSMVGKAIQNNKKAQEEWNRTIEEADHRYKMLLLDKMDYEQSNIFGVEDPFKRATMGAAQYQKAMQGVSEITEKLAGGQVQTGTKKALDWGNIGKGAGTVAAVGAALGTIFPVLGNGIGLAIGAAVGAIAGALSKKVVPVFEDLTSVYGELFDPDTYELNPKILADYDKLDEDTKQIVSNWEEVRKKAEEARKELKDNLKDFTGDLGKKLEDTIVNAWKNHRLYSAVDDYKKYVGQKIASILEQQAFSAVFESLFDDLGKRMEESFIGPNADNSIIDDLDDFNQKFPEYLEAYGMLMDQLDEQMQGMGYDGFRDRQSNANASAQSFQQISETTGSAIQGGVTALRLSSEVRNQHLSVMSENLSEILLSQLRATTIAEDIRRIQADAYLAILAIRNNTADGVTELKVIRSLAEQIERKTREL